MLDFVFFPTIYIEIGVHTPISVYIVLGLELASTHGGFVSGSLVPVNNLITYIRRMCYPFYAP